MGCTESYMEGRGAALDREVPGLPNHHFREVLGQGTYGVVYAAWDQQRKVERAVKMINLGHTPLARVQHEACIMRTLAHPCIAHLHDAILDRGDIAYLVMDLYKGGSVLEKTIRHWQTGGSISISAVQNLAKMMVQPAEWLHRHSIIHRDLKGENFLLNRRDLEHPQCRVFLCDFGTACALAPEQRLSEEVGTQFYWAPELYGKNYGLVVDVWALGVITFGLLWGRFPFINEGETKALPLECPAGATDEAESFVRGMLTRDESSRLTARMALRHTFLASIKSAAEVAEGCMGRTISGATLPDKPVDYYDSGSTMAPTSRHFREPEEVGRFASTCCSSSSD